MMTHTFIKFKKKSNFLLPESINWPTKEKKNDLVVIWVLNVKDDPIRHFSHFLQFNRNKSCCVCDMISYWFPFISCVRKFRLLCHLKFNQLFVLVDLALCYNFCLLSTLIEIVTQIIFRDTESDCSGDYNTNTLDQT